VNRSAHTHTHHDFHDIHENGHIYGYETPFNRDSYSDDLPKPTAELRSYVFYLTDLLGHHNAQITPVFVAEFRFSRGVGKDSIPNFSLEVEFTEQKRKGKRKKQKTKTKKCTTQLAYQTKQHQMWSYVSPTPVAT